MIGKKMTGIESLWSTTEAPPPISKELQQQHGKLIREYQMALYRIGGMRRVSKSLRDAEEVARANLRAFERRHGLTSPDPRIG